MARSTPVVNETSLVVYEDGREIEIEVGLEEWFTWLERDEVTIFAFVCVHGTFSARKEGAGSRRGGWYWKAYRKYQGKLYRAYLGKARDLTLARLREIAKMLVGRIDGIEKSEEFVREPQQVREENVSPLLETKLCPPRLPHQLVERARLLSLLDVGQKQKLTLLQAPAGFGKTTLATQWAERRKSQSVAWIALDSGDNDPLRFWFSVVRACRNMHADIGQIALTQLTQPAHIPFMTASLETAISLLLNDIAQHIRDGVLIIDEYHLIEYARIHETFAFFIEYLPSSFHVLVLTRSEPPLPLVRWRARGELFEVHASQLSFSLQETKSFMQQFPLQAVSEEMVQNLHTRLEGWGAGLRLFALTPGASLAQLHRPLHEYMVSEVLSRQLEGMQLFLLQTSMLGSLNASLCRAVTESEQSFEWLGMAERAGFIEVLDSEGQWYRYRPLFAEVLRAEAVRRLGEGELQRLALKAGGWYEERGLVTEAIEAALAGCAFVHAADLIGGLDEEEYFAEQHTMRRWLRALPLSLLQGRPALCFRYAQAQLFSENIDGNVLYLEQVEDVLQMAEVEWGKQGELGQVGTLYAFRTSLVLRLGIFESAIVYARRALELLPFQQEPLTKDEQKRKIGWIDWRCICLCAISLDSVRKGRLDQAYEDMFKAYTLSLAGGNRVFTNTLRMSLGEVCFGLGELQQAAMYYRQTLVEEGVLYDTGVDVVRANAVLGLVRISYEQNKLAEADQLLSDLANNSSQHYFSLWQDDVSVNIDALKLLLLQARGESTTAELAARDLLGRLHISASPNTLTLICDVLYYQLRMQIKAGELEAAERTLQTFSHYETRMTPLNHIVVQLAQARIMLAQREVEAALQVLHPLLKIVQQGKYLCRIMEVHLLIAQAYMLCQREQEAMEYVTQALRQARRDGFLRVFLDEGEAVLAIVRMVLSTVSDKVVRPYAQRILHAFLNPYTDVANDNQGTEEVLLEPLSAQERRVLALLAVGQSNLEIAEQLVISVNTVKGHVKNIYSKLMVNNRTQAVEVARRLKLV